MTKTRNNRLRLLLTLALVVIAGLTAVLLWDRAHQPPPQIITLPDGSRFRLAGVTYGTNLVPPALVPRLVDWLPARLATLARRQLGNRAPPSFAGQVSATPQLAVWFQSLANNPVTPAGGAPTLVARLSDENGTEAGFSPFTSLQSGASWSVATFSLVPKRSRMLRLTYYPSPPGPKSGPALPLGQVTFPNPLYGRFPDWQREPIPAVKQVGDLKVNLTHFETGTLETGPGHGSVEMPGFNVNAMLPALKGRETSTRFFLSVDSSRADDKAWVLQRAELSDATGNVLRSDSFPYSILWLNHNDLGRFTDRMGTFSGMLWPDESAWRLKLEFKRAAGFAPGDLVTFSHVPIPAVGATNAVSITNIVGGIQIVLRWPEKHPIYPLSWGPTPVIWPREHLRAELPGKPPGVALDLWGLTTDAGDVEANSFSTQDFSYAVGIKSIPTNAQTMDLTFVVQKTHTVEFLVAPPKSK